MKKELKDIFSYYKKKYNLKTTLKFTKKKDRCYFDSNDNIIRTLNIDKYYEWKEYSHCIYILLHEIKHAIDFHKRHNQLLDEMGKWDDKNFPKGYRGLLFERRANYFAKKELTKWIKII